MDWLLPPLQSVENFSLGQISSGYMQRNHCAEASLFRLITRNSDDRFHIIDPTQHVVKIRPIKLILKLVLMIDGFRHRFQVEERTCYEKAAVLIHNRQRGFPHRRSSPVGCKQDAGIEKRTDRQC